MAAETLSALEVSNWHLVMVAFAAMTLIFAVQYSNDVLRMYALPLWGWVADSLI